MKVYVSIICVNYINVSVYIFKLYENLYFKTLNMYSISSIRYKIKLYVILCKIYDKQHIYYV